MVQKQSAKRGRPRSYDPDTALAQAMAVFWDAGYAGTSLDDISEGTGLNRPSLYSAFGDKRALYLKTLRGYRDRGSEAINEAFGHHEPLRAALRRIYERAVALYLSGESGARGCFLIGTAVTEAVLDPEVRTTLREALREFDVLFEKRIRRASEDGELQRDADPVALARVASAILHTLAIRSRAGEPRKVLDATIAAGLDAICGRGKPGR